jgi:hypothetical protein
MLMILVDLSNLSIVAWLWRVTFSVPVFGTLL